MRTAADASPYALRSFFLLGLFLLFKFLPKDLINMVLTGYFVVLVRTPRTARVASPQLIAAPTPRRASWRWPRVPRHSWRRGCRATWRDARHVPSRAAAAVLALTRLLAPHSCRWARSSRLHGCLSRWT